ncbi:putative RNA polymerase sigma factor FecI [Sinobacterium norvegicum]|uniref:RNA polymerase sigma factor FecI n=1 Tax=Sinobacterium norvegicum TaxID=1641715 RepID=A0ABN8EF15_9GAMM|nr:RNA polymerase sigma factor [Sinobacterium norvegicum]CAH0990841.1 putative RNA polymerase sigma factor FecI [Sinobacterium norvegicum]
MTKPTFQWLEKLIHQHGSALERFLTRKLNNPDEAAELAQETYLKLYKMEQQEALGDAKAFMYRMAGNLAIDQIRRRQVHERFLEKEGEDERSVQSAEQSIEAKQQLEVLNQALSDMPQKPKQALLLHRQSGLSYSQIAQEMGVSVSSVEKFIIQALKHCREAMK